MASALLSVGDSRRNDADDLGAILLIIINGVRYVAPAQRHAGTDTEILARRHEVYIAARQRQPRRWSGRTRNWAPVGAVTLNPERDSLIQPQQELAGKVPMAA